MTGPQKLGILAVVGGALFFLVGWRKPSETKESLGFGLGPAEGYEGLFPPEHVCQGGEQTADTGCLREMPPCVGAGLCQENPTFAAAHVAECPGQIRACEEILGREISEEEKRRRDELVASERYQKMIADIAANLHVDLGTAALFHEVKRDQRSEECSARRARMMTQGLLTPDPSNYAATEEGKRRWDRLMVWQQIEALRDWLCLWRREIAAMYSSTEGAQFYRFAFRWRPPAFAEAIVKATPEGALRVQLTPSYGLRLIGS